MSNYCELPDDEIVRLRDEEDMYFTDIKEKLELACHPSTISRHYRHYKKEHEEDVLHIEVETSDTDTEGKEVQQEQEIEADEEPALQHIHSIEHKSFWQKVKEFFRGLFLG